ncbi:hypothetical protein BH24DEI2_BH24DEI2_23210 [soil metagenome]
MRSKKLELYPDGQRRPGPAAKALAYGLATPYFETLEVRQAHELEDVILATPNGLYINQALAGLAAAFC